MLTKDKIFNISDVEEADLYFEPVIEVKDVKEAFEELMKDLPIFLNKELEEWKHIIDSVTHSFETPNRDYAGHEKVQVALVLDKLNLELPKLFKKHFKAVFEEQKWIN